MASTRNKNTPGNFCLFLKQNYGIEDWQLYKHGGNGIAYDTRLPGNGLNPAQIPWNQLSHNAVDIETFLFGINSTNLVNPAPPLTPELKCLKSANVYESKPVIMPVPQAIPKFQRPMFLQ
jgi:hypothetical protein